MMNAFHLGIQLGVTSGQRRADLTIPHDDANQHLLTEASDRLTTEDDNHILTDN